MFIDIGYILCIPRVIEVVVLLDHMPTKLRALAPYYKWHPR